MTPARCRALEPSSATAMARSHMRMRPRSPMLTQSDTAPMVQKRVLLPTAPKTKARRNAPPTTYGASCAGFSAPTRIARCGRSALGGRGEALPSAHRGAATRIARDQLLQRLLRLSLRAHRLLRTRDAEHRIGCLGIVRPRREQLPLRGDRALVIALAGIGHADPVLRVGREAALGIGHHEALHGRHRKRVVAQLELVK